MVTIKNNSIVNNLTNQTNWRLGSVLVNLGHVKIIHEEHQNFASWWTVDLTSSFINVRLNDSLKGFRVCVVVKVKSSANCLFKISVGEIIFKDNSLTSTSISDEHHTFFGYAVNIDKELLASRLCSWYDQVVEQTVI